MSARNSYIHLVVGEAIPAANRLEATLKKSKVVIPDDAKRRSGSRRPKAEANMRFAHDPKGEPQSGE